MNRYASWVYMTVLAIMLIAGFLALPNLFGESLAVQVSRESGTDVPTDMDSTIQKVLGDAGVSYKKVYFDQGDMTATFPDNETQLRAKRAIDEWLQTLPGSDYQTALNFASNSPGWLRKLNMRPVHLGLDLRGGVYLLFEVDMDSAISQAMETYVSDFKAQARAEDVPGVRVSLSGDTIRVSARGGQSDLDIMSRLIRDVNNQFLVTSQTTSDGSPGLPCA